LPLLDKFVKADKLRLIFVTEFGSSWMEEGEDYADTDALHKTMLYRGKLYPLNPKEVIAEKIFFGLGPLKLATMGNRHYMYVDTKTFQSLSFEKDPNAKKNSELLGELLIERHALNFLARGREKALHRLLTIFGIATAILAVCVLVSFLMPYMTPLIQQLQTTPITPPPR